MYIESMSKATSMMDIIRNAIERDRRTIYRIALESGVNAAVIRRFVSGERGVNLETADRLCKVLGLKLTKGK